MRERVRHLKREGGGEIERMSKREREREIKGDGKIEGEREE